MKFKDERSKLVNQTLLGVKMLKMYAWELIFEQKVTEYREKEVKSLKKIIYFMSVNDIISLSSTIVVCKTFFKF